MSMIALKSLYDCYIGMQEEAGSIFHMLVIAAVDSSGSAMVPEPIHSP